MFCSVIITRSTPELNHSQAQRNGVTICIKLVEYNQTRASGTGLTHLKWRPFLVSKSDLAFLTAFHGKMAAMLPQIPEQFQPQTLFSFPQRTFGKNAEESSFRAEGSSYYRSWFFGFCIICSYFFKHILTYKQKH